MATHYFHDSANQTVYRLRPNVSEKYTKHKPPRWNGCHVWGDVEATSSSWRKIGGRWTTTWSDPRQNHYEPKDDAASAERYFVTVHCHMGKYTRIDKAAYDALVVQYQAQAKATKPPDA